MLNVPDLRVESFKSAYNSTLKLIDCLKAIKKGITRLLSWEYIYLAWFGVGSFFFKYFWDSTEMPNTII